MIRALALFGLLTGPAFADEIIGAQYADPTTRYPHGVLGDAIEYETLRVTLASGHSLAVRWAETLVFEDTAPRPVDVTGDGLAEVLAVQSHERFGAQLAVYGLSEAGQLTQIAATPFIGTRFRWLAPLGAADIDGDGRVEIAFVDRPHLAKTLRIYEYSGGDLQLEASFSGVTNHRIGEEDIAGGIRTCADAPEMIVADAGWSDILAIRWDGAAFDMRRVGPHSGRDSFSKAMLCKK